MNAADDIHEQVAAYALNALDEDERARVRAPPRRVRDLPRRASGLRGGRGRARKVARARSTAPRRASRAHRSTKQARRDRRVVPAAADRPARRDRGRSGRLCGDRPAASGRSLAERRPLERAKRSSADEAALAHPGRPGKPSNPAVRPARRARGAPGRRRRARRRTPRGRASGKTYEAWVIRGEDAEPAGVFAGHGGTAARLTALETARAARARVVAVTVERRGGVFAADDEADPERCRLVGSGGRRPVGECVDDLHEVGLRDAVRKADPACLRRRRRRTRRAISTTGIPAPLSVAAWVAADQPPPEDDGHVHARRGPVESAGSWRSTS